MGIRARFIGDPAEREGGQPLSRPAGPWFEVVDAAFAAKIMGNSHYEIEGAIILSPTPKRTRKAQQPELIASDDSDNS